MRRVYEKYQKIWTARFFSAKPDTQSGVILTMERQHSRLGLLLFLIYLLLYGGFVLINTFRPDWMQVQPLNGVNLAIVYGFGLILAAFLLALIYGLFSHDEPPEESP